MFEISVEAGGDERHVRVSARELVRLVRRAGDDGNGGKGGGGSGDGGDGGDGERPLLVRRISDPSDVFLRVSRRTGRPYAVEHHDGTPERYFRALTDSPWAVVRAIIGWARREDGWDTGLAWSPLDTGPAGEVPPLDLPDGERERLEEYVREVLVGGYVSRAELAEYAEDYLATAKRRPVSPEQARALADRLWLERVAEQAEWQGETDPERITRAFTALRESGITAHENFTCCSTCGDAEIGDAGEPGARGYVYFHTQCTDAAAAGHGLTLFYGGFDDSRETAATVGREVVAALEAVGLRTEWDGDPDWAIVVTPLDWRRRLAG
ncbi:DUF6891 domain-containing protein [Streptomyces sudanensis]|uniref:DUF6891 domain-containing protein n=1 Tax=Streptomyces sudanensis TaxID=436397 RepID=UPI0020CC1FB6|nr:hypothetical protein [Streptomyces sudanensis]MCP9957868.1 hypothetical protein [Streptomyces sudanensis]MCQ0001598.1 hypothetical protein [Streptomyces sudanensis]